MERCQIAVRVRLEGDIVSENGETIKYVGIMESIRHI